MLLAQRSPGGRSPDAVTATSIPPSFLPFFPATPCRVADTRGNGFSGAYGPPSLSAGAPRDFVLNGQCGIPSAADAVSVNVTVTNAQGPGFILIYPSGSPQPTVSTLNYLAGQTVANAAIVRLGNSGGVTVVAGVSGTDLVIDVNGFFAGTRSGGVDQTFLGINAGGGSAGSTNVGIGADAMFAPSSGSNNVAVGPNALFNLSTGSQNTAVGFNALVVDTTGNQNVAVGASSLQNLQSGSNNVCIGPFAGTDLITGSNNIYIDSPGFIGGEQGQIRIGNANHVGAVIQGIASSAVSGVQVLVNGGGRLGVATSSARFKEDIRDIGQESDGLMELRPVSFRYKREVEPSGLRQFGLVAEEVARVYPDLVTVDDKGRPQAIRYQLLVPMLLNEAQKDRRTIASQESRLEAQERRLEELSRRLEAVESGAH